MRISEAIRIFLPLECPVCGKVPWNGEANQLCGECLSKIEFLRPPFCPGCGGELSGILDLCPECMESGEIPWDGAFAAFRMRGAVKDLIHSYKYKKQPELARALGDLAAQCVLPRLPDDLDWIVPVPLHWTRMFGRGYNQAQLIAERLSLQSGIPVKNLLRRVRRTERQAKLQRKERIRNLSSAFSVIDSTKTKKRAILLVDDVMTTGSTLSSAALALKKAGAGKVYVFAVARRQRN